MSVSYPWDALGKLGSGVVDTSRTSGTGSPSYGVGGTSHLVEGYLFGEPSSYRLGDKTTDTAHYGSSSPLFARPHPCSSPFSVPWGRGLVSYLIMETCPHTGRAWPSLAIKLPIRRRPLLL